VVQVYVNNTIDIGNGLSNVTFVWLDRAGLTSYSIGRYIVGTSTTAWTAVAANLPAGTANALRSYTTTVTNGIEYEFM
jgi:hypothetical protein